MPDDPTPHGGEALHPLPDRGRIPTPRAERGDLPPDPGQRPPLPTTAQIRAADLEDEDADPVVDSGPGIDEDTGKPSVTRQPAE